MLRKLLFLPAVALLLLFATPQSSVARGAEKPAGEAAAAGAHQPVEIGLQVYSLRDEMSKDVPATLRHVKELGFKDVELGSLYGLSAQDYRKLLDENGLKAGGIHVQYDQFRNGTDGIIKDAKTLGVHYVIIPWIPHKDQFTADNAREAAAHFNKWGEALQKAGLQLGYHPHGYEFRPAGKGTVFDIFATETQPDLVIFELDVFWAFHAGQDPAKFMQKYQGRVQLLHLKDMKKGTPTGLFTAHAPKDSSIAIGAGMIDFPALMKEAEKIGVKHYYIEDEASTAAEQIPLSVKYLKSIRD